MLLIQSRPPTTRGPEQYVSLIGAGAAGAAGAAFSNTLQMCALKARFCQIQHYAIGVCVTFLVPHFSIL